MIAYQTPLLRRRESRATNPIEATISRVSLIEIGLQNEEDANDRTEPGIPHDNIDNDKHFGDLPGKVHEGQVRLCFANIYGIPATADHPKNTQLRESINRLNASVIGLAETNIHWKKVKGKDRWEERRRGWWENDKHIISNNQMESPQHTHQPGGTMNITKGQAMFRIIAQGVDLSKMGRWCWTLLSGKRGVNTRIITAYRPCVSNGLKSTYRQQRRILDAQKCTACPRQKMLDDLSDEIKKWSESGDQIILMIDLNDNVISSNAADRLNTLGLTEAITQRHDDGIPPSTCIKGTTPIDGIFISSTLQITRGGYLPYGQFPTDHRALWVDITMENLCGSTMAPILAPQARRLKCNDPKTQGKWINLYHKYLNERNAIARAYMLQSNLQQPLSNELIEEYETLRIIRMDARKFADKRCRKLYMGGVPFSPAIAQARSLIELWKAIVSWKMGSKHNMKHIGRLEKKTGIQGSRDTTLTEAKEQRSKAYTTYWELKKQAKELRMTFLQTKARDIAQTNNLEEDNVYNQLITREAQRSTARKIKYVLHRTNGGGVTKVSLRNDSGHWEETTVKEDIETGCAQENASKYRQTENTPCMQGQLVQDLGYLGNTPSSQEILDGLYQPPPDIGPYTREFLNHLRYDTKAKINPPLEIMTTTEYIQGWKKKKENTSAGKSGWTFSHSKTCALDKRTADFEATMAHIPYVTGYAPTEWKTGVNIMIYKKANLDRVDKLRTIVLKEADANFNDGKLGRDMMHHAERHNMIAKEQYGSRKGHCSIDHAVNKRLTFDLLRLCRAPGALCSNDAKSCYDRILHAIAALSMKRLGIPTPPIECMLKCIQQMEHYIRTTHGDSDSYYSSKYTRVPFQGVLQGNGAAPSIWVAVSTPLLNMMRTANHGLHITSAISKEKSNIVAFAFVDDTDLVQSNITGLDITAQEIMEEMQQAILRWEGGLKATGGALVPSKSFVYPIDFQFDRSGKASYKTVEDIGAHFEAPNADGRMTELEQVEPSEARETLGVFLAPDGNNSTAISNLKKKARDWSNLVLTGHLSADDIRTALNTTIVKSLEYPLPALTLTEKECKEIIAPVLAVALPKSKVSRTYPRAVVYGPKGLLGLGMNNLYYVQGTKHIALLHQYVGTDTITGELLRACIEITKVHVGHVGNIFTQDHHRLGRLAPKSWISHLWQFCHHFKIKLVETATTNVTLSRVNDKPIMETIAAYPQFTANDLTHINRCRLFLKVMTLSDITNGTGTQLRHGVLQGTMMELNTTQYLWPRQDRPGITSWRLWRKAMKTVFMRQVGLHLKQELILGEWNDGKSSQWNWFLVRNTQRVYQRARNTWRVYRRRGRGRIGMHSPFTYFSDALSLPSSAKRCTVYKDSQQRLRMTGSSRDLPEHNVSSTMPHTILDTVRMKGNEAALLQSLRDGTAKAVSDGSYLASKRLGTAAFIVEGCEQGDYIRGSHETPGSPDSQCAHRSEMFGILALILLVNKLCTHHQITEGRITAKCDGEGTIKVLRNLYKITKNTRKHYDLIISITKALELSPLNWNFHHLDGHQDDYKSFEELDRWAQLNVMVDKDAKKCLTNILRSESGSGSTLVIPYYKCTVSMQDHPTSGTYHPISSHLAQTILKNIQQSHLKDYWIKKKQFSEQTVETIDWKALTKSANNYARNKWLSKFVTGICGVGSMLKIWKHQKHSSCPRCGHDDETTQHVLLCQEDSAVEKWDTAIAELNKWMEDNNASPAIQSSVINHLRTWQSQTNFIFVDNSNLLAEQAIEEQTSIGWNNFLCGFISNQWRELQQQHLTESGSRKSAILWISRFQRRIWEIPWSLWQHRNGFLHNDGTTIHFQETVAINNEIRAEYATKGRGLPASYLHLYRMPLDTILKLPIFTKREWLLSVWVAQDHYCPNRSRIRNEIAKSYYDRWIKHNSKATSQG